MSLVAEARARLGGGGGLSAARAQRTSPSEYRALVREIEWKLVEMPLPRLQEFGGRQDRFIYEIEWGKDVKRREFNDPARFHLVVAHERCNGRKTDHLAAAAHVEAWRTRLDEQHGPLTAIANSDGLVPAVPAEFRALLAR
ncbi:MAG: hypothetical protein K8M05_37250 [Deltaproteobacteria bacterium]|nr:hypothetical protein [Kofleriaceae bacterium]